MMKTKEFWIDNRRGLKLAAKLDLPDSGNITSYAVYAHCFTCSMELKAIPNITSALTEFGIAALRFDMTGIGESEGVFSDTNFTTQLEDFASVVDFLTEHYNFPGLFIGHSLGGSVALFSAFKYPLLKAVVTIASPAEPSSLAMKLKNTRKRAEENGTAIAEIGGACFEFKPQFFEDIEKYHLEPLMPELNKAYLALHSPVDTYSDYENAEKLYRLASQPKAIISLGDIDHLMLNKKDAEYVGSLIGAWSEKYLKQDNY